MGWHVNATGGQVGDLGGYIDRMAAAGLRPVVCAVDDAALAVKVAEAGGIAVYSKDSWRAAPDYNQSPEAAARERWAGIRPLIPPEINAIKDRVVIEIMNEPDQERARFVFAFMLEITKLANADGYIVGGPSWSAGNPYIDAWETDEGLAFLSYYAQHRDKAKVLIHEYSLDTSSARTGAPWMIGRFQFVNDILADNEITAVDYIITECGWSYEAIPNSSERVMSDLAWMLETYGNIPFCLWTLGQWQQAPTLPGKLAPYVAPFTDLALAHYEPDEPEEPMDWREEAIQVSNALRKVAGINWNPDHGYIRWAVQQPGHYAPGHTEYRFTAQDGTVVTIQVFADLTGEHPDKHLAYTGGWRGMEHVEVLTEGDPILFSMPVGTTKEERESGVFPPGDWNDANPYGNHYKLRTSFAYHTGSDLNLNKPSWDSDRGQPVYAIRGGVVTFAGRLPDWGNVIVIKHDPTPEDKVVYSRSAHMGQMFVTAGKRVARGDSIGTVGRDAHNGPYHLHFDISPTDVLATKPGDWPGLTWSRIVRDYVDPKAFLESQGKVDGGDNEPPFTRVIGTDVSHHNGTADFDRMASKGAVACYVRSSIGGTGLDNNFARNWQAIDQSPMVRGMYHLFKSTSTAEENLANLIRTVREHGHGDMRIAIDVEPVEGRRVNGDEVARLIPMFEDAFGYEPLIYTALWIQRHIDGDQSWMNRCLLWLARYLDEPPADDYYPPIPIGARRSRLLGHQWTSSFFDGREWGVQTAGLDVNVFYNLHDLLVSPVIPDPPAPPKVDLLPYLRPATDGPLYELRRHDGSQERVQTHFLNPIWFYTKGTGGLDGKSEWEELTADGDWILRGIDTSPGRGEFYELRDDPDEPWSRWGPRRMAVGETYRRAPWVIFRRKDNCNETLRGQHLTTLKLEAVHDKWTSPYNDSITLEGVAQIGVFHADGRFFERYWYARGYGLVGFVGEAVTSYISEIHQPGQRPPNEMERIPCL